MTCNVNIYNKVSAMQCHNYNVQSAVVPPVTDLRPNNLSCKSLALSWIDWWDCKSDGIGSWRTGVVIEGLTDMIFSLAWMFVGVVKEIIYVGCLVMGSKIGQLIGIQTCLIGGVDMWIGVVFPFYQLGLFAFGIGHVWGWEGFLLGIYMFVLSL